ncbi:MAG: PhzF family phenazine biosynthesis protein [Chloroflexota bacterium]
MTSSKQIFQIDAFTERIFGGNAAAVCLLGEPCEAEWMQELARELNQSSTTFITEAPDGFSIRWFTRREELVINGTGTLCSAHVLWETGRVPRDQVVRFQSRSGELTAQRDDGWIEIDFPAGTATPAETPDHLVNGLGATPMAVVRTSRNVIALFETEAQVRALEPDYPVLARVEARGIIATASDVGSEFDFISRYFAPAGGMNEDPVNGSSHTELGPLWQARLGRDELLALQASPRGGVLRVRPRGERVLIAGKAVTVARGELA